MDIETFPREDPTTGSEPDLASAGNSPAETDAAGSHPDAAGPAHDGDASPDATAPHDADAVLAALAADEAREMQALEREWSAGTDWDDNLAHGQSFVDRFGDDAARKLFGDYGLGDHAAVVRVAARAGRHIANLERELAELKGEAPVRARDDGAPAVLSDTRRGELVDEHRRLRAARDYWTDGSARRRVREIMEALHGTRPIPVHGGRGDAGAR